MADVLLALQYLNKMIILYCHIVHKPKRKTVYCQLSVAADIWD